MPETAHIAANAAAPYIAGAAFCLLASEGTNGGVTCPACCTRDICNWIEFSDSGANRTCIAIESVISTSDAGLQTSGFEPQFKSEDGNKNVSGLIDFTQSLCAHYSYTPFGALLSSSGSSSPTNPFRFSSEFADDASGLVYYNYRHYNPEIGRWMRRDRLHEVNGYFFGESVNCFDLKGMKVLTWDDFTHIEDTSDFGHNARIHTTWNTSKGDAKIDIIRYHGKDCKDAMQVRRRDGMYEGFVDRKCPCDECAEAEISFPLFAIVVTVGKHKSVVNKNRLDLSDDLYLQHEQIHLNISEGIALETQHLVRKIKKLTKRYCNEKWAEYFAKHDQELYRNAGKDIAKVFDQGYERKKEIYRRSL